MLRMLCDSMININEMEKQRSDVGLPKFLMGNHVKLNVNVRLGTLPVLMK